MTENEFKLCYCSWLFEDMYSPITTSTWHIVGDNSTSDENTAKVCHVDLSASQGDSSPHPDLNLDYENLLFVHNDGNMIHGRMCHLIYEEYPDSQVSIVGDMEGT